MKILMIAINDPAGTAVAFTNAINQYTEHSCRLITKEIRYNFMFEKDLHLPWLDKDGWGEVEESLKTCDIMHFHMTADEFVELGPFMVADYMRGKVIVHHHHGHPDFRSRPDKYRQKYKEKNRLNLLVSTPDLLKLLPEAKWQPNLVPIDDLLYTPMASKPEYPVIISHSPTKKDLKNTNEFISVLNRLKRSSPVPIEMRLIENTPHKECLQAKRASHILFDHLQGYFGVSSLEGLSQGLCVIAGLDDWNKRNIESFTGTNKLPWIITNRINLYPQFQFLIENISYHNEKAKQSRLFMDSYWRPQIIVRHLTDFYNNAT